ncbi:MAG: DUF6440 family protein [Christensenellales bacterium]|jgi:hypothetical protein
MYSNMYGDRFLVEKERASGRWGFGVNVIVDRQTGVQYLYVSAGYGAGMSPLLDKDGKPLLHEDFRREGL